MIDIIPDAELVGHRHSHPVKLLEWTEWQWQPGKTNVAEISEHFLFKYGAKIEGNIVTIGPYRLRVLGKSYYRDRLTVTPDGWRARLLAMFYSFRYRAERFHHRLMLTLAIWDLADHTPGAIPSWKDIYLVKRFTE